MNKTLKRNLKIALNVIIWMFVLFSVVITIMVLSSQSNNYGIPSVFGKSMLTIQSDSMNSEYSATLYPDGVEPSGNHPKKGFKKGDVLFVKIVSADEAANLKKGDVITFIDEYEGASFLNTHRIVEDPSTGSGGYIIYSTQGDNREVSTVAMSTEYTEVVAYWTGGKISGLGNVIDFLKSPVGFMICIVLPLAVFFLFELVNLIKIIMTVKVKTTIDAQTEEEIKKRAIEEYLRQQEQKNNDKK